MDDRLDNPLPSISMDSLTQIGSARTSTEVIRATVAEFGPDAVLYAVDHEFGTLVRVGGDGEPIPLRGQHRSAVLCARHYFDGERTWIPLPERDHVIFVVTVTGEHATDASDHHVLGSLLGGHRDRFEDLDRSRRRAEMAVAAELQWELLPARADALGGYQLAGILEPAYEVAGDMFEYALNGDSVWAYSFDGMGHGLDATLTSVLVISAVRNSRREGGSLGEQMQLASEILWQQYGGDRFVTGAACRLDPDGTVEVVNAGHEPIRVVADGLVTRLELEADLPLGVQSSTRYRTQRAPSLAVGDGLVMFSDGPAAQTADGDAYGDDHLDEVLRENWCDVPLKTGHDVIGDVLSYLGDVSVDDDITAVVIRRDDSAMAGV